MIWRFCSLAQLDSLWESRTIDIRFHSLDKTLESARRNHCRRRNDSERRQVWFVPTARVSRIYESHRCSRYRFVKRRPNRPVSQTHAKLVACRRRCASASASTTNQFEKHRDFATTFEPIVQLAFPAVHSHHMAMVVMYPDVINFKWKKTNSNIKNKQSEPVHSMEWIWFEETVDRA